ncbi:reverse transcriptase [Hirsutella rhossiliensis]
MPRPQIDLSTVQEEITGLHRDGSSINTIHTHLLEHHQLQTGDFFVKHVRSLQIPYGTELETRGLRSQSSVLKEFGLKRALPPPILKRSKSQGTRPVLFNSQAQISTTLQGHGRNYLYTYMRQQHHIISRDALYAEYRDFTPENVRERWGRTRYTRRDFSIHGPDWVWSIDGYDKLKNWGFEIYAGIDAYSRYITWFYCGFSSSTSWNVAKQYLHVLNYNHFTQVAPDLVRALVPSHIVYQLPSSIDHRPRLLNRTCRFQTSPKHPATKFSPKPPHLPLPLLNASNTNETFRNAFVANPAGLMKEVFLVCNAAYSMQAVIDSLRASTTTTIRDMEDLQTRLENTFISKKHPDPEAFTGEDPTLLPNFLQHLELKLEMNKDWWNSEPQRKAHDQVRYNIKDGVVLFDDVNAIKAPFSHRSLTTFLPEWYAVAKLTDWDSGALIAHLRRALHDNVIWRLSLTKGKDTYGGR